MKTINPLLIDKNTKPSFETPEAKWYLIKEGKHYAAWRWDSKKHDVPPRRFLITDIDDGAVVSEEYQLEAALIKVDFYDRAKEE